MKINGLPIPQQPVYKVYHRMYFGNDETYSGDYCVIETTHKEQALADLNNPKIKAGFIVCESTKVIATKKLL
jgi:hypothetical protein